MFIERGQSPLFFNDTAPTEIYTLSLHDALPIWRHNNWRSLLILCFPPTIRAFIRRQPVTPDAILKNARIVRSEEHTSELQSLRHLVCRLLLEKKKHNKRGALDETALRHMRISGD